VHFAQRDVTRAASAEEHNRCVTPEEFIALRNTDGYALCWEAHGLFYGIRTSEIAIAEVTVCSVSRAILADAAARFPVRVVEITASPGVLAQRLAGRGREGEAEIAERLARQVPLPSGIEVVTILNDGSVAAAAVMLRKAIGA
jgi:phosphonate metabolism protein PhnN/1,5-bisphosphokinase (PRPP-forming)